MSLGVGEAAGAGNACHPSSPKCRCSEVRSACQSWTSAGSVVPSTTRNLRQSRIRATSTCNGGRAASGRFNAKRAAATSQITWPCRLERHGCHGPTCSNDCSASYGSALRSVTTWRPSSWSCARNSAAIPSRSTTTRCSSVWSVACS